MGDTQSSSDGPGIPASAESALEQSARLLAETERIAKIGHWKWDEIGDRMLFCSRQAAAIFGLSPDEFRASSGTYETFLQRIFPDDRNALDAAVEQFYRESREDPARAVLDIEYRIVRADKAIRHVRERAGSTVGDRGSTVRSIGTIQDITKRKEAEELLRTRDAWLRSILENSPIEIVLKDSEGRIMAISQKVLYVPQHRRADSIGKTSADFFPPEIASIYTDADRSVLETGQPLQQEVEEEFDGKARNLLNAKFPLNDDKGQIIGVCSLTSDITELKDMQARFHQAQKMEAVAQLTAGIAHDFNNILAIIQGNAELLSEQQGGGERRLETIVRSAERGAVLTQRLLSFSRQQPLMPRPVGLVALLDEMVDLLKLTLGDPIEIETTTEPGLWAALIDPVQFETALLNLAINARDAMPGGGRLTIGCANIQLDEHDLEQDAEAPPGDYVVLTVSDTGTGMPAAVLKQAVEPFFSTKAVGKGSGLGLSMVYGFAKQSGGHLELDSKEGKGTTVRLYLPRGRTLAECAAKDAKSPPPPGHGETVLVIEDNPQVRALAVEMLEDLDYRVIDVPEAASARAVLERGDRIDVLLSDVLLPGGLSGPGFAEEVKERCPGLRIIFMSGYSPDLLAGDGLAGQVKVQLKKPFQRRQLAQALRDALD